MNENMDNWIKENVKCCYCCEPLTNSPHINIVSTKRKADWEYLVSQNMIFKNSIPKACGILCDKCIKKKKQLKYVIKYPKDLSHINYIKVESLEIIREILLPLGEISGFAINCEKSLEEMMQIDKDTQKPMFHYLYEFSNLLKPIIKKWLAANLNKNPLNEFEFKIIRYYIWQWIYGSIRLLPGNQFVPVNYETNILKLEVSNQVSLGEYIWNLLEYNLDPF